MTYGCQLCRKFNEIPLLSQLPKLAHDLGAHQRVMDDRCDREIGAALGLTVTDSLGILQESYRCSLISNTIEVASHLRSTEFRVSRSLSKSFEEQFHVLERPRRLRKKTR
jgi:predicted nucleic acid-binding protein